MKLEIIYTPEEIAEWCDDMMFYLDITFDAAYDIAWNKILFQNKSFRDKIKRDLRYHKHEKKKWIAYIKRLYRERNVLKKIECKSQAISLLDASIRHNYFDYDKTVKYVAKTYKRVYDKRSIKQLSREAVGFDDETVTKLRNEYLEKHKRKQEDVCL
jgi:hypothetical protein